MEEEVLTSMRRLMDSTICVSRAIKAAVFDRGAEETSHYELAAQNASDNLARCVHRDLQDRLNASANRLLRHVQRHASKDGDLPPFLHAFDLEHAKRHPRWGDKFVVATTDAVREWARRSLKLRCRQDMGWHFTPSVESLCDIEADAAAFYVAAQVARHDLPRYRERAESKARKVATRMSRRERKDEWRQKMERRRGNQITPGLLQALVERFGGPDGPVSPGTGGL